MNEKKILYACDKRACENCREELCRHTSNINHAKHFKNIGGTVCEIDRAELFEDCTPLASVNKGDTLILKTKRYSSEDTTKELQKMISDKTGCEVIVLSPDIDIEAVVKGNG